MSSPSTPQRKQPPSPSSPPEPQPQPSPPEQCYSSHHDFHSSSHHSSCRTNSIKIQITDTNALIPTPCVPTAIPSQLVEHREHMHLISSDQWMGFANDANREISEWKVQAERVQWWSRTFFCLCLLLGISSIPLFLLYAHDHDGSNSIALYYQIGAILLLSTSIISLLSAFIMVYRGASIERSARSDLIAILDWYSDETEDDNNLSFELVKSRERSSCSGGDGDGTGGSNANGRLRRRVPIYHYYIKIVVKTDMEGDEEYTSGMDEEEGSCVPVVSSARAESDADRGAAADANESLEQPLLTSAEREMAK